LCCVHEYDKEYRVLVARCPNKEKLDAWKRGVVLGDGYKTAPADVHFESAQGKGAWIRVVMVGGRKRQIRVICSHLGLPVIRILRIRTGNLRLGISAIRGTYVSYSDPRRCTKGSPQEQADCLANAQALHQFGLSIEYYDIHTAVGIVVEALPMILVGILIFSRKSSEPFGLIFSLSVVVSGTVAFDTAIPYFYKQVWSNFPVLGALVDFMLFLGNVLIIVWYLFPEDRFMPRWTSNGVGCGPILPFLLSQLAL
jgi:hypothetical protein